MAAQKPQTPRPPLQPYVSTTGLDVWICSDRGFLSASSAEGTQNTAIPGEYCETQQFSLIGKEEINKFLLSCSTIDPHDRSTWGMNAPLPVALTMVQYQISPLQEAQRAPSTTSTPDPDESRRAPRIADLGVSYRGGTRRAQRCGNLEISLRGDQLRDFEPF